MLKKYLDNTSGNIAVIFAVSLMGLLAGVGAAIDFTSMVSKKTNYQALADSAVLAAARSGETTQAALELIAIDVVNVNNNTGDVLTPTLSLSAEGRASVTINGTYNTVLMGMFGSPTKPLRVEAEAPLPSSEPVNIALVLDTTGSMQTNNKIGSLKTAATDLVTALESQNNASLKIAVIPFSQYVNVGLSRRNEVWIENTTDTVTPLPPTCYFPVVGQTNCRMEPYPATPSTPPGTCFNDGVPYPCGGSSGSPAGSSMVCDNVYGPTQVCTPNSSSSVWHGCVGSRLSPWHERHQYASNKKIPGLMDEWCGTEILALTNNLTTVKDKIDAMTVGYSTYIPSGLIWGWRALETVAPLTEASGPYAPQTKKVMILMTDGDNTLSKNGVLHDGNTPSEADDDTTDLCTNINNANVDIYTIAYDVSNASTRNMLQGCATDPAMYYDARNAAQLQAAFEDIGAKLVKLRLTH